ncbi:MAG TPA: toll/interleukin-1 receptor domain-containing protein [Bacteroidota bacterium]|nr:toll/interleukin-1 receptor domain-containing protein [Bacteroidota bacterium]
MNRLGFFASVGVNLVFLPTFISTWLLDTLLLASYIVQDLIPATGDGEVLISTPIFSFARFSGVAVDNLIMAHLDLSEGAENNIMFFKAKQRNMLFLSHAWEDFEFTKWLALKLASEGYGVWSDVTQLLGGENWPKEINEALQSRTCRFLFVLSKYSNTRPDPLGELETARKVMKREGFENFIKPLKVDDILRDEVDYRLQEIQTISFEKSWAEGLSNLLDLLSKEVIPKNDLFSPDSVNEWWKKYGTDSSKILSIPEDLSSNQFSILSYPDRIYAHFVNEKPKLRGLLKYPVITHGEYLLSFTEAAALEREEGLKSRIIESIPFSVEEVLNGSDQLIRDSNVGEYYFKKLLNQVFDRGVMNKGLASYQLSSGWCYYFHEGVLDNGTIRYRDSGRLNSRIKLWGKHYEENWHWALRARVMLEPEPIYSILAHILVTNDKGVSSAPKGVYKSWRNDTWRDRLRASFVHLAEDDPQIVFELGSESELRVSTYSTAYVSSVSYEEPKEVTGEDE